MKRTGFTPRTTPLRRDTGVARATAAVKQRKCEHCKTLFTKMKAFVTWCSPDCGYAVATARVAKRLKAAQAIERKADRAKREAMKSRSQWLREAQAAFNKFIRLRDKALPCVSCLRFHTGSYDAGHYRTVGSNPALRFDGANVHRQCVPCNQHLHGNTVAYRAELLRRVGPAEVDRIEGPHDPKKYTVDDLREIRDQYRRKAKEMTA